MTNQLIFKICARTAWDEAVANGRFTGAAIDVQDGFIHFSTSAQVRETAAKHFANVDGLVLVTVPANSLGDALKWETSRVGALFPHLYGTLDVADVARVDSLVLGVDGAHLFPEDLIA